MKVNESFVSEVVDNHYVKVDEAVVGNVDQRVFHVIAGIKSKSDPYVRNFVSDNNLVGQY